ncbi:uncharacterized protein mymx isoform X4 [Cynoglossus semilaevis]|uniref:uncharacterized protein mymx isoform X4 n=1 Tax=Cynoglossus semilaevis TaxID=244447 RepID=UPI000D6260A9|nr:uncharacterized protein LOC103387603 isoform X4 [Cynoglossus semilaevis]
MHGICFLHCLLLFTSLLFFGLYVFLYPNFLPQPAVPQSSACKNFWRRCQGLLENTFGSLKRKRKIYRPSANEVSTYLHVKDNNLAAGPVYESISLPRHNGRSTASASPTLYSSSSSSCSSASGPQSSNVTFHPLTGSGSSSIFSSLKRMGKRRKRKGDARRHTIQKIMGVEAQTEEEPQYACEGIIYDTHTWPLKEGRRKKSSPKGPVSADEVESLAYVKNPLAKDIETECSGEYSITPYAVSEGPTTLSSTNQVKSHCRFMSLGSVLSFELPKDMSLIPSIQDIITIAPPESKKAAGTDPDPHSQRHLALSSFKQTRPNPVITQGSSEPSTPEIHTSSAAVKAVSDMNHRSKQAPSLTQDQSIPNHSSKTDVSVCEAADPFKRNTPDRNRTTWPSELPIYVNQAQCTVLHKHQCPSVHTRIRDLNGHIYHRGSRPHSMHEHSSGPQYQNQASHVRVNLKSTMSLSVRQDSVDSGISTSSCIKVSTNTLCPDAPPKGVVGRIMSFQVEATDCTKPKEDITTSSTPSPQSSESQTEPVHLDHKQFQEEEEELEDIWNQTNCRQSISSDIIYQSNQEDPAPSLQSTETHAESPSPETPNVLYRNLVTASAPNLLVAEFKLPSHIQSLLGYNKEQNANRVHLPPLAKGDRRSWAAFPHRESNSRTAVFVNETASDPVKLPDVCDNQRYIYQYKEDEEEGGDMVKAKVMEEVDDHTGCLKDQSMSLLSVHMDLGAACQQKQSSQSPEHVERQGDVMATGGRRFTLSGKSDLQSMEGTLERKHKLQLGGKKVRKTSISVGASGMAASRGWNSYHAVLFRNTLCFYQDRKETLKSSACGLPLNLMGAECSPAPDYTKKSNCFRLQLRDGSEYLFNAPSRFMMRKWVIKIQANTGQSVSMSSVSIDPDDPVLPSSLNPSSCPSCRGLAKCHCSSRHDVTSMFPRHKAAGAAQTKEIVVLTREFSQMPQSHLRSLDEQSVNTSTREGCCGDDEVSTKLTVNHRLSAASTDSTSSSSMSSPPHPPSSIGQDWLSNKRRSHSFTSATYQKIKPIPQPPGGLDRGSNYCVTLVVGDKLSDGSSTSRTSEPPLVAVAGWQQEAHQDSAQRSYTSLPRPRNKSVFKKFFGKKDL